MESLKYTIIKNEDQYFNYCNQLEMLTSSNVGKEDEIELLILLIEKWDEEHSTLSESDPIQSLKYLIAENKLKAIELAHILGVSKGLVSDILNYKKGLSKEVIRLLASHFKVSQEAFNKPYKLKSSLNSHLRNASVMNTKKEVKN